MRHVLSLDDLTTVEIQRVLEIAVDLKAKLAKNERPSLLAVSYTHLTLPTNA